MRQQKTSVCALKVLAASALLAGAVSVWAADKLIELNISGDSVPAAQRNWRVTKGDRLTLRISGDTAGQLHLHAYQIDVKVVPGQTAETSFTAHATGRFRLQFHPAMTEPTSKPDHHTGPLATLDVIPQ